jgi:hypothetical protein
MKKGLVGKQRETEIQAERGLAVIKQRGGIPMADSRREEVAAPQDGGIKINWDAAQMKTSYANVCNVSSTREEVTLLFGTNQTWQTGQKELTVNLSERIILNAYAAKRLSLLLSGIVKEYEARFGELNLDLK